MSAPNEKDNKRYSSIAEQPKRADLPHNIEAEQAVLSACLLSSEAADEITITLKANSFFRYSHRIIFNAIVEMVVDGTYPDVISLIDKLQAKGQLEEAGGRVYLADLNADTFALTNWQRHMEIVQRTAIQRELIRAAAEINALAYDAPEELSEVVGEAEQALFNVTEKSVSTSFVHLKDVIPKVRENLEIISKRDGELLGVPTGFKDLDEVFQGFRGGNLVVLAARPGVGKTALALNMAVNAAKAGVAVAFFSMEMSESELTQRMVSSEARVNGSKLSRANLTSSDKMLVADAFAELSKLDIFLDASSDLSIMEARAKARRQMRSLVGSEKKGLIVVDYLQLMKANVRRDGNRAAEVGEISRGLKIMAKEMDMPVLALAQLNRVVTMTGSKRPQLSNLRESGSIEQDADIVMFIDRSMDEAEAEDEKNGRPPLGVADIIVAKHRNGRTADVRLAFNPEYTKFSDYYDDSYAGGI